MSTEGPLGLQRMESGQGREAGAELDNRLEPEAVQLPRLFGAEDMKRIERINAEIQRNGRRAQARRPLPLFEETT